MTRIMAQFDQTDQHCSDVLICVQEIEVIRELTSSENHYRFDITEIRTSTGYTVMVRGDAESVTRRIDEAVRKAALPADAWGGPR